jgi:hypothetical protein
MAQDFRIPPTGFGPGSQPATGAELDFMPLPKEMATSSRASSRSLTSPPSDRRCA